MFIRRMGTCLFVTASGGGRDAGIPAHRGRARRALTQTEQGGYLEGTVLCPASSRVVADSTLPRPRRLLAQCGAGETPAGAPVVLRRVSRFEEQAQSPSIRIRYLVQPVPGRALPLRRRHARRIAEPLQLLPRHGGRSIKGEAIARASRSEGGVPNAPHVRPRGSAGGEHLARQGCCSFPPGGSRLRWPGMDRHAKNGRRARLGTRPDGRKCSLAATPAAPLLSPDRPSG